MGCRRSRAPDHPNLQVRRRWGQPKTRNLIRVSGVSPPLHITGFNNDIDTLERAVKERVFFVKDPTGFVPPPKPVPGHFSRTLSGVREALVAVLPRTAPLSRAAFVSTFRGRKLRTYTNAYNDLLRSSFNSRDAHVKVFVKYEKTDFTSKTDPVPRVISPRSPRYNVELGRYLRKLEEKIFVSLSKLFGHPTVFKGVNSLESGRLMSQKWGMFRNPVAIGLDASRFDQHVSVDALRWEHSIYIECFRWVKHRIQLAGLLGMQLRNECVGYVADGRVRYFTNGGRMSGDMNTSLGNCVLMCSMIKAYADSRGVQVQLANNGDDCVVFLESVDLAKFSCGLEEWFLAMGFRMVVEAPCYSLEAIEFCQTHPVFVGPGVHDYLMVRHPRTAIAKDTVCVHNYTDSRFFRGWLHAVAEGGLSMSGGVPIFQDFYKMYHRCGAFYAPAKDSQSWGVRALSRGMSRTFREVLPVTRASFYWAFGVTPDEQLVLEDFYSSVDIGRSVPELTFQVPMPL